MNLDELHEPLDQIEILHAFADYGIESAALSKYGNVTRISINPKHNRYGEVIKADLKENPLAEDAEFDIGLFHPPCTKWSDMPSANTYSAENLIPLAREIAEQNCKDYIIENKPRAPLKDAVNLDGKMFGLPIAYERAFETSFEIPETPTGQAVDTEVSPYFYSDRSVRWWCSVKGCPHEFPKKHIAKNTVPSPYIDFLMRNFLNTHNRLDADLSRSSYRDEDPARLS